MTDPIPLAVDEIGQYVNSGSCIRHFHLALEDGKAALRSDLFTHVGRVSIDPILAEKGRRRELLWSSELTASGFKEMHASEKTYSWDEFKRQVVEAAKAKNRIFARQVALSMDIGPFRLRGKPDFIVMHWENNRPRLRVVECKSTRKEKTYHHIQLAAYLMMVRHLLKKEPLVLEGITLGADDVEAVVARINEETGVNQEIMRLRPLRLEAMIADLEGMLRYGGRLSSASGLETDKIPYCLNPHCDSCPYSPNCLLEGQRYLGLELLGLSLGDAAVLRMHGVRDLRQLAELTPTGEAARGIKKQAGFRQSVPELICKARARLSTMPQTGSEERQVLPKNPDLEGQLPSYTIGGLPLVRVYICAEKDYSEDRLCALSAHITSSQNLLDTPFGRSEGRRLPIPGLVEVLSGDKEQKPLPFTGREVVEVMDSPWTEEMGRDDEKEAKLIKSFFAKVVDAIAQEADGGIAPIHFYFWSQVEVSALVDACHRCGQGTLEHLVHILGCREALDQMIYSTVQDEVKARYALGWTSTGLVPTTSLRWFGRDFHWTRSVGGKEVNLATIFRKGLFDFKAQLWMNGTELQGKESPGAQKVYIEARAKFNDSLPLSYLEAAWGTLGTKERSMNRSLQRFEGACDLPLLQAYVSARAEALRWLEERIVFKNRLLTKQAVDTAALRQFRIATGPAQAALDFLRLEFEVRKVGWFAQYSRLPEDLIAEGMAIPLRDVEVSKVKVGEWTNTVLSAQVDLDRFGETVEGFRDKCDIWDEEWFRYVAISNGTLPLTTRNLKEGGLTMMKAEGIDDRGRIKLKCIARSPLKASRYVAVSDCGSAWKAPHALLLKSISSFQDDKADATLQRNAMAPALGWFDRLELAVPEMPAYDPALLLRCTKALTILKADAQDKGPTLSSDQVETVIKGLGARVQIIQGPPGTGKTTTTAADALLRASLHQRGEVLLMAGNTHRAKDELRDKISNLKEGMVRALRESDMGAHDFLLVDLADDVATGEAFAASASGRVHVLGAGTISEYLRVAEKHLSTPGGVTLRTLVVDEASMMVMPHFMALASYLAPDGQVMLSGDNRQLAPILEHDWENEDRPGVDLYHPYESAFVGLDSMARGRQNNERKILRSALSTTYRLPPDLCDLIAGIYKLDNVELNGKKKKELRTIKLRDDPFAALWSTGGIFLITHDEAESHNFNRLEARLLQKIMAAMPSQHLHFEKKPVVVITPHRVQRAHLRNDLSSFVGCVEKIDTVERMQGGEANTVIVSVTQSDPAIIAGEAGFILGLNRSNVMLSRSRERLIVVCAESLLNSVPADFDDYQTSFVWKNLRGLCTRQLTQFDLDGHLVKLFVPNLEWIRVDYGPQGPMRTEALDLLKGERRELWNRIEDVEVGLRRTIRRVMSAKNERWEEELASSKRMDRAREHLIEFETRHPGAGKGLLDFTYLADLFEIVVGDWPLFSSLLGRDKNYWSMKSNELNYTRNVLAHFNGDCLRANEIQDAMSICDNLLTLMGLKATLTTGRAEATAESAPPSPRLFGKYAVRRNIGSGGFSDIYQVECQGIEYGMKVPKGVALEGRETVAVTLQEAEAYRREAAIWSELTQKLPEAVVALIEAGEMPFPWFVMELAESDLKTEMVNLSEKEKRILFDELLLKLQSIHEQGVLHKDLKPENILLVNGVWKFTDFGLAKLVDASSRSSQGFKGTMVYMAPEQTSREFGEIDVRTDVWQMGILLVELFKGEAPSAMFKEPDLSGLPDDVRRVAAKALQREKKDRFQSVREFQQAMAGAKAGRRSGLARMLGKNQ